MRLHVNPHCITIHISEESSHLHSLNATLSHTFSKTFWVNETLINLATTQELKERKAFLTSLYYTCAFDSKSHNLAFLERLIAMHDKPIKVIQNKSLKKKTAPFSPLQNDYRILGARMEESLQSIRKKYLALVKQYHPDALNKSLKNKPLYIQKFQQIQEAYERIKVSRKEKRAA